MMKSYVAKTTINLVNFEFYIRPGDLLVHDPANQNRLTVYRNGQIVKVVKQDPLGLAVFLKVKFIEEVTTTAAAVTPVPSAVVPAPEARPSHPDATTSPVEPPKPPSKKDKAVLREVLISDSPRLMEALSHKEETEATTEK